MPPDYFCLANTVTRMMSFYMPFLLIGNVVIGVIEGFVLSKLFKAPAKRAIGLMIGANYLSAFAGVALFGGTFEAGIAQRHWPVTIENYHAWIVGAVAVAFVVTVVLEWPFCHASFDRHRRRIGRTVPACVLVQTLSYLVCLAPFSWMHWQIDVGRHVTIVESPSFVPNDLPFWVYYIDPAGGDIHRMRPDGTDDERFLDQACGKDDKLSIYHEHFLEVDKYDLCVTGKYPIRNKVLVESFALPESMFVSSIEPERPASVYFTGYYAADLRSNKTTDWRVQPMLFSGIYFRRFETNRNGEEETMREWFQIQWSSHFGTWQGHNPSILPGDIVIFELGGQICALDLNTRRLAFLRFGSGPVVVRDETDNEPLVQPP